MIKLLPSFYLSDMGLLIPIFFVLITGQLNKITSNKFLIKLVLIRIFVSIFSGLSLVAILPSSSYIKLQMMTSFSIFFLILGLYSTLIALEFNLFSSNRVATETTFIFNDFAMILFPVTLTYSLLIDSKKIFILSLLSLIVLSVSSAIYLQTRSLVITYSCTLLFCFMTTHTISQYFHRCLNIILNYPKRLFIIGIISISLVFNLMSVNIENFLSRTGYTINLRQEENAAIRIDEVITVFNKFDIVDYILGNGIGPDSSIITERGDYGASLHIGILNILWRFGAIVFSYIVFIIMRLFIRWISALRYLRNQSETNENIPFMLAYITCCPGFFALIIMSCMSGGWSVSSFLPLGILLGFMNSLIANHSMHFNARSLA
ncbi:hypothetical protein HXX01_04860 [Candidatus Nomurabacteria bacterium]|nr:hypothetical protein [Candidatus Nomurabacteria bacterium]